eukprot:8735609-Pyramimonas_sp.AAC.1
MPRRMGWGCVGKSWTPSLPHPRAGPPRSGGAESPRPARPGPMLSGSIGSARCCCWMLAAVVRASWRRGRRLRLGFRR